MTMTPQEQAWKEYEDRKAAQERERDEHTAKTLGEYNGLLDLISSNNLPTLKGSEKQVKWAESIRATAQMMMQRVYRPGRNIMHITDKNLSEMRSMATQLQQKDAQWWIQNRSRWGA